MPGESGGAQVAPEVPVSYLLRPRFRGRGPTPPLEEDLKALLDDLITPADLHLILVLTNLQDLLNELANYVENKIDVNVEERKPPANVIEKLEETVRSLREAANAAYNARQTYMAWLANPQRITTHIAKKLEEMIMERLGV